MTKTKKSKTGRPKKEIDQKVFESLCGIQCTEIEICDFLDIDDKTLTKWCDKTYGLAFSEVFKAKKGKGIVSLRRRIFQSAETSVSAQIFLSKQHLGYTEAGEREFELKQKEYELRKKELDLKIKAVEGIQENLSELYELLRLPTPEETAGMAAENIETKSETKGE